MGRAAFFVSMATDQHIVAGSAKYNITDRHDRATAHGVEPLLMMVAKAVAVLPT